MPLRRRHNRRGSVLMEFLLACPLVLILVSFLLQSAHVWIARQMTAYAAYCAARAELSGCDSTEAARSALSWMCLAGLNVDEVSISREDRDVFDDDSSFHELHKTGKVIVSRKAINFEDTTSGPLTSEFNIPGWGSVPGSSSRNSRVKVTSVDHNGNVVAVTVTFDFPLLFPIAARVFHFGAQAENEGKRYASYDFKTGKYECDEGRTQTLYIINHRGDEKYSEKNTNRGINPKYFDIKLTETCVLPMPYRPLAPYSGGGE